jgi:quinol---cytochrome c reductase iron-sulfur subunit, bacillus type
MQRSLNPRASGGNLSSAPPLLPLAETPPRRNVLAAIMATIIGGIVSLFPLGAGALVFLDPILRGNKHGGKGAGEGGGRKLLRVATKETIPTDGTPVQVPVLADLKDAWNLEPMQPIGAVYLRSEEGQIKCFNAICPHAGCFVAYSTDRKCFQCPCHTSAFELDGKRIMPSPSPRDMDTLKVDEAKLAEGEVWVEFVNYYPGKEKQEPKP